MPAWFASFFLQIATSIASILGISLAKKTIFATAAIAAFTAVTGAFVLIIKGLLMGLVYTLPPWAAQGVGLFLPTNLSACISIILGAKIARWLYEYYVEAIKIFSYIT